MAVLFIQARHTLSAQHGNQNGGHMFIDPNRILSFVTTNLCSSLVVEIRMDQQCNTFCTLLFVSNHIFCHMVCEHGHHNISVNLLSTPQQFKQTQYLLICLSAGVPPAGEQMQVLRPPEDEAPRILISPCSDQKYTIMNKYQVLAKYASIISHGTFGDHGTTEDAVFHVEYTLQSHTNKYRKLCDTQLPVFLRVRGANRLISSKRAMSVVRDLTFKITK